MVLGALSSAPDLRSSHPSGDSAVPTSRASGAHDPSSLSAPSSAREGLERKITGELAADGVPARDIYLPNFLSPPTLKDAFVHPEYQESPAPMGIGDIGVRNTSGTAVPYTFNTTSWSASFTIRNADSLYLDGDDDAFTIQLNTVLANTTVFGNTTDAFWTQNVLDVAPASGEVQFVDNIWNFSNPTAAMPTNTFYPNPNQNGSAEPYFYGAAGPEYSISFPFTVNLYINSSLTIDGGNAYPTVRFGFELATVSGAPLARGIYDTVEFNSNTGPSGTPVPEFRVDGSHLTPVGLPYNSEIVLGGPGSGSSVTFFAIDASAQLRYLNATTHAYQNAPSAITAGVDTAETSTGVAEYYTTPGTMEIGSGPSLVQPMWNETPGGNAGEETLSGTVSPANSFIFINPGTGLNRVTAGWAPTQTTGSYSYDLPPATYAGVAELSDYDPMSLSYAAGASATLDISLTRDMSQGVYTPLYAWDNAEYGAFASSGDGSAASPYVIDSNQGAALDPLFAEINDDWFPTFSGVFFADSTAHVDLLNPPSFYIVYPEPVAGQLAAVGLPTSNDLQIELYNVANVVIWGGTDISGWFGNTGHIFPLSPLEFPLATLTLWNVTDSLIGDNTFFDQGVSILMLQGGGNVVWGNHIDPGPQVAGEYAYASEIGISAFESGDLVYDNSVTTTYDAYAPDYNEYTGAQQTNLELWNLPGSEPASQVRSVDGFNLSGSIVNGLTQCGNYWGNYIPGGPLPFTDSGDIAQGGDYCPLSLAPPAEYAVTFTEGGLPTTTDWSVSIDGLSGTAAAGSPIAFSFPDGTYDYGAGAVAGYLCSDPNGTVTVNGGSTGVAINYTVPKSTSPPPTLYLVEFTETGLFTGASWSVVFNGTLLTSTASAIATQSVAGSFPYTVANVTGYSVSPATGTLPVGTSGGLQAVAFTGLSGVLSGTVSPSAAQVLVNGVAVTLTTGSFNLTLPPGVYFVEVTASGYATYFNNVTVSPEGPATLTVDLEPVGSSPSSGTSTSLLSTLDLEAIVGAALILAVAIVVAALLLRGRSKTPPQPEPPDTEASAPPS
jgi:thermopsin